MTAENQQPRHLARTITGMAASDGAGVKLSRVMGQPDFLQLDPFLLLDHFHSDQADDYIAGFPPHPHRGFETVTYLLAGRMRHKDSSGTEGIIESGGIQWMTAGRGIIHSEMPEQENGLLSGFQLWINLPASHKMMAAGYQEHPEQALPIETRTADCSIKVIAGTTSKGTRAPVQQRLTDARFFDISLAGGASFEEPIPQGHTVMLYTIEGTPLLGSKRAPLEPNQLGVLEEGDKVEVHSEVDSRFLLIAGKPLHEPVARQGPFVMNTEDELRQAFKDYQNGTLTD